MDHNSLLLKKDPLHQRSNLVFISLFHSIVGNLIYTANWVCLAVPEAKTRLGRLKWSLAQDQVNQHSNNATKWPAGWPSLL